MHLKDKYQDFIKFFIYFLDFRIYISTLTSLDFYSDRLLVVLVIIDLTGGLLNLKFLYKFLFLNCLTNFFMSGYPLVNGSFITI